MMHYQLYVPIEVGKQMGTAQQALERAGLGDMIPGHEGRQCSGPGDSTQGHLLAWRRPGKNESIHYNASEQTWIPSLPNGPDGEGKGRYWVGFWNDSPITPEDLQRSHAAFGAAVVLGDDNNWMVPVAENFTRDLLRDDDGSWKFEIQRQHQHAWNESRKWLETLRDNTSFAYSDLADFAESYLKLNYRIVPEVTSHLQLFNTDNLIAVLSAILSTTIQMGETQYEQQR